MKNVWPIQNHKYQRYAGLLASSPAPLKNSQHFAYIFIGKDNVKKRERNKYYAASYYTAK